METNNVLANAVCSLMLQAENAMPDLKPKQLQMRQAEFTAFGHALALVLADSNKTWHPSSVYCALNLCNSRNCQQANSYYQQWKRNG